MSTEGLRPGETLFLASYRGNRQPTSQRENRTPMAETTDGPWR